MTNGLHLKETDYEAIRTRLFDLSIPEPNTGCWLWTKRINRYGYAQIKLSMQQGRGRIESAHRVSYQVFSGKLIPGGMGILHRCDMPCCVNPDHLFVGSHDDNMADMARKGRNSAYLGSDNYASVLTEEKVLEIRASTLSSAKLAAIYGVSKAQITRVKARIDWKHVPEITQ